MLADVLHPVRAIAAARKHEHATVLDREPDLYPVGLSGLSAGGREVREVLSGEALEHPSTLTRLEAVAHPLRDSRRHSLARGRGLEVVIAALDHHERVRHARLQEHRAV